MIVSYLFNYKSLGFTHASAKNAAELATI